MLVALDIQHAIRMRRTVMCPVRLYNIFSTLSHKRHDFRRKVIEGKICVLIFSTTFCPKYVFWFSLQLSVRNMRFDFLYNFLSEICILIFSTTFCPKYVFWFSLQLSVRNMCFDFLYNFLSKICVLIFSTTFYPKYVFWFSLQLSVRNIYHCKKNSAKCDQKSISAFM